LTNIAAYVPFLLLTGTTGDFLYSLPIIMACSLVASRLVSMTFVPLLGYYLLRPARTAETSIEERRQRGFTGFYYRLGRGRHQAPVGVVAGSLVFLVLGAGLMTQLKQQFFPEDVQYWSYVDVWLPNDAPLSTTNETARRVEEVVREVIAHHGREHPG